jgi:vancomycin permeability regulator SanA
MLVRMLRRRWVLAAALLVLPPVAVAAPLAYLYLATLGARHSDAGAPVAIVFGAGLRPDGAPTPLLADRVDLAVELLAAGRVRLLLFTGDHGTLGHDEVGAMARYAVARGVPAGRIVLDHAGFDTYASCYRARSVFGVRRAVVVTTRFHLPRAIYTCRRLGVRATGAGTPDWSRYRSDTPRWQLRELAAAGLALWQLHVTHPSPRYPGPPEPIPGL